MNFCDAVTCFRNNFGDDSAGPTHVCTLDAFPKIVSKGRFSWAWFLTQGLLQGWWTRGAEPDFWVDYSETSVPEEFSEWGNVLEETSHQLLKKWAKLINRGINVVKKDVLSSPLFKKCTKPDQIFSYHNSPRAKAIISPGSLRCGFCLSEGHHWHWDLTTTATLCCSDFLVIGALKNHLLLRQQDLLRR